MLDCCWKQIFYTETHPQTPQPPCEIHSTPRERRGKPRIRRVITQESAFHALEKEAAANAITGAVFFLQRENTFYVPKGTHALFL